MPRLSKVISEVVLVLASFLIAIAIWIVAKQNDFEKKVVAVPVEFVNVPDYLILETEPETVNVTFQYPKALGQHVLPESFSIQRSGINESYAGLEDFREEPIYFNISNIEPKPDIPREIRPVSMNPNYVTLKAMVRTVPAWIRFRKEGEPAEGYHLLTKHTQITPHRVLLAGSEEAINKMPKVSEEIKNLSEMEQWHKTLESINTDDENSKFQISGNAVLIDIPPVDIEGRKENFMLENIEVPLPDDIKYVNTGRTPFQIQDKLKVDVHVVIGEKKKTRTISGVPIIIRTFSKQLKPVYSPTTAKIKVEAPVSMIDQLGRESFVFLPRQPLEETAGYSATVAIDAKFSDAAPQNIREKAAIVSFEPQVIQIEIVPRSEEESSTTPTPSVEQPVQGEQK